MKAVPTQAPACSLELCGSVSAYSYLFFFGFFFSRFGAFLFAMGDILLFMRRHPNIHEVTRTEHLR